MAMQYIDEKIEEWPVRFYRIPQEPFTLEGLPLKDQMTDGIPFLRFPEELRARVVAQYDNPYFSMHIRHTAGAAVRFRAKPEYVFLRATLRDAHDSNNMCRMGSRGFDLYCRDGEEWHLVSAVSTGLEDPKPEGTPPKCLQNLYGDWEPWRDVERDFILNLPLYSGVEKLELGFNPSCVISAPTPHRIDKPVCFYGSSITQGGCASHPGNAYTSLLCREVDAEQVNFGNSGGCRGEDAMAELMASMDFSCLVLDYDHNAPDAEHLRKTHEKMFRRIREAHPQLPVILISKPNFRSRCMEEQNELRRQIIRDTYEHAVAVGDKKVWFIDGDTLFNGPDREMCTVDGCHPNDLGFQRMFRTILPVLQEALASR